MATETLPLSEYVERGANDNNDDVNNSFDELAWSLIYLALEFRDISKLRILSKSFAHHIDRWHGWLKYLCKMKKYIKHADSETLYQRFANQNRLPLKSM